jgi:PAS domain S-box-containing protein
MVAQEDDGASILKGLAGIQPEYQELFEVTQEAGHLGLFEWLVQAGTLRLSSKLLSLYGLTDFDGLYQTWLKCVFREDVPRINDLIDSAFAEKARNLHAEFRIVRPIDGRLRWIEAQGVIFYETEGRAVRVVGVNADVTERKRAIVQLRAFTETLEERVRERTRELEAENEARRKAEQALREAQMELWRANRIALMGQFTASVAHEVSQPIAAVRINASAALHFLDRNPPAIEEVREALGCVLSDTDRARDIIGRIRDHIKKAPPRKDTFDVNDAIDEVIALTQIEVAKNRISVQRCFAEGLFPLQADRVQLQQVALNLMLNAVEAMSSVDEGPRELLISTEQSQVNGVVVAVRDSGPGIDQEHLERVFETFYTTKSSGIGMGLSISRSIVEAHGGRLWASANEPRGAIFQFTVPAKPGGTS